MSRVRTTVWVWVSSMSMLHFTSCPDVQSEQLATYRGDTRLPKKWLKLCFLLYQSEQIMEIFWPIRAENRDILTNQRPGRLDNGGRCEGRRWASVGVCVESPLCLQMKRFDIIWTYLEFITMLLYWVPQCPVPDKSDISEFKNIPPRVEH